MTGTAGLWNTAMQFLAITGAGVMGGLIFSNFRPTRLAAKFVVDLALKGCWAVSCIGAFLGSVTMLFHMLKSGWGFVPSMAAFGACIIGFTLTAMRLAPMTVDRDDPNYEGRRTDAI